MQLETSGHSHSSSGRSGSLNALNKQYDLPSLIEKLKDSQSWKDGELKTIILLNIPGRQIVLTALHEGTEIDSFQTCSSATFQIIEGKIFFRTKRESQIVNEGQVLTLYDNVKYSFSAKEETVVLVTLANCT
jgi:quercetin dioxygenase-like cupin family protein